MAPWTPLDCHAHTTMSDGELTVEQLIEKVRARGARPGISDHLSRSVVGAVDSLEGIGEYLDELALHDVARGGEFCWHDSLWRELPPAQASRFSHRIGSLHAVFLPDGFAVHAFSRSFPDGLTRDAFMEAHASNAERLSVEMPVDILAHPTLLPLSLRALPAEEIWTEAHEDRLVDALFGAGIAFEISNRYRPHERLVRRAVARGVRISLGSDGHGADQVGDLAFPLALARACGVNDEDLYDPAVHGRRD